MNAASGIYRITNTVNGKVYIGSSKDMAARCRNHRWALNAGTHGNSHLQAAWNKYGPESFEFGVFLECSDESLLSEEQGAISTCRSFDRNAGYNMKTAVRVEMREETKRRLATYKGVSRNRLSATSIAETLARLQELEVCQHSFAA